jgi:hypothetical protein
VCFRGSFEEIQKGGFTGTIKLNPGSAASFEEPTYLV